MKKQVVIDVLDTLGDELNVEQLMERLLFVEQVEKGLADVAEGRVVELDQVKQKFADKWAK